MSTNPVNHNYSNEDLPPKPDYVLDASQVRENFPKELQALPNWVCWKYEFKDGDWTKVPYQTNGKRAKSNDPSTWTTLDKAIAAATDMLSTFDGVGFMLSEDLVGIDFDERDSYGESILKTLGNPYCEASPSGKGLHAIVHSGTPLDKQKFSGENHTGIEIYRPKGRYLTATGEYVSGNGVPHLDISLPYLLISQNQNKKFKSLWTGDTSGNNGDDSSADASLCCQLAVLLKYNKEKIDAAFRFSGLMRDKWSQNNGYYANLTISNAIKFMLEHPNTGNYPRVGEQRAPQELVFHTPALPDPNGEYVLAPVPGQADGWFPLGDVSLIGGSSGVGKTSLILEMLHKQKQGFPFLDHRTFGYGFHVLAYDRGKNAFERTMIRLNLRKEDVPTTPLSLAFGIDAVQGIINEIEKMSPIPSVIFVEGLDMLIDDANKKSVVSPFMRHLQDVAKHFHIALVCSVGAPKAKRGEDYTAKRDKLSGSEAWGRNCETVVVLEFSEEDDGTSPRRELTVLPRNAPAEKFSLQFEGGRLVPVAARPEEEKQHAGRPNDGIQAAMAFLRTELQGKPNGVLMSPLLKKAYEDHNLGRTTMYKAKDNLHVIMRGEMTARTWTLPMMHEGVEDGEDVTEEQMEFKTPPPTTPL